ncbi:hypothetical protein COB52_05465 [Candidatus Kaiserbacteria bacterium]|nr:MAG: hypothetical protein COB52_05465 [Candidatus Kaiserbacteria bacterium]
MDIRKWQSSKIWVERDSIRQICNLKTPKIPSFIKIKKLMTDEIINELITTNDVLRVQVETFTTEVENAQNKLKMILK